MFGYRVNARKRPAIRQSGVTLIEAVLFISVALGLIVGGIVFYRQASLASRVGEQVRMLSALSQEFRIIAARDPMVQYTDVDDLLIAAGAVPAKHVLASPGTKPQLFGQTGNNLATAWQTELEMASVFSSAQRRPVFLLIWDIPVAACARLGIVDGGGASAFVDGIQEIQFRAQGNVGVTGGASGVKYDLTGAGANSSGSFPVTPAMASQACASADPGNGQVSLFIAYLIR